MKNPIQKILPISILSIFLLLFSTSLIALPSDFISPSAGWYQIQTKDHKGMQKLLTVRSDDKEQIYLYWMSPNAETNIQSHTRSSSFLIIV